MLSSLGLEYFLHIFAADPQHCFAGLSQKKLYFKTVELCVVDVDRAQSVHELFSVATALSGVDFDD